MFCLLLIALFLAVSTEVKTDSTFDEELGMGQEVTENLRPDVERRDSIR